LGKEVRGAKGRNFGAGKLKTGIPREFPMGAPGQRVVGVRKKWGEKQESEWGKRTKTGGASKSNTTLGYLGQPGENLEKKIRKGGAKSQTSKMFQI